MKLRADPFTVFLMAWIFASTLFSWDLVDPKDYKVPNQTIVEQIEK